ncbi:MAG: DegT/DnrJ/EryC1/StrS family aminotransferase [Bacteroidota bacterium]|nr:DegT/DnrJ/EryC1/StrS family aminotransferase [Bacteroidota bacterium]
MTHERIWLSPPHLTGNEQEYINEALATNWVSPYGENINMFEDGLKSYFGLPGVALTISGTSAIHLALILAGVGPGDEVILPTLNFAGCVNPVLYQNAVPLFIDSERSTWNIDPNIAEDAIKHRLAAGKKPKAILAVHLFGIPCLIEELLEIGRRYEIPVIEDAPDAIGARINGQLVGTFGQSGIISFNGNKILTTSGGGALISNDTQLIAKAKYLSNQARKFKPYYVHEETGYNYMMSNVLAGIGRAQLAVVEDRVQRKRAIYSYYEKQLAGINDIIFHQDMPGNESNRWLSTILVEGAGLRNSLYESLKSANIEARPVWRPMHKQPAYDKYPYYGGNIADHLFECGLCLPSGTAMQQNDLDRVVNLISTHYHSAKRLSSTKAS